MNDTPETETEVETPPETPEAPEAPPETPPETSVPPETPPEAPAERPSDVPEKFWDADTGAVRTDALLKSYLSLEKRFGATPDSPDAYEIESEDPLFASDPEINARLHAEGLTNNQAQAVYALAADVMRPLAQRIAAEISAQRDVDWLAARHGGENRWRALAPQIKAWAAAEFPPEVYEQLAATREGVMALSRLMTGAEPSIGGPGASAPAAVSEDALKNMMRDPRYWRDRDPAYMARVSEGFRQLYPD
ncbi:MAG: capsid assembly protein [Rhodospirillales bacterium]